MILIDYKDLFAAYLVSGALQPGLGGDDGLPLVHLEEQLLSSLLHTRVQVHDLVCDAYLIHHYLDLESTNNNVGEGGKA